LGSGSNSTRRGPIDAEGAALWRQLEEDSERKRLPDEKRMKMEAQAIAFASTVFAIVGRHVPERERCASISANIARLIQQDVSPGKRIVTAP